MTDMQGTLIVVTAAWAVLALIASARKGVAAIVTVNLVFNLLFFLSHPILTPYYLMPLAMLSLWSLLFMGRQSLLPLPRADLTAMVNSPRARFAAPTTG